MGRIIRIQKKPRKNVLPEPLASDSQHEEVKLEKINLLKDQLTEIDEMLNHVFSPPDTSESSDRI